MSDHRNAPLPVNYRNVRPGVCRWCDAPVLKSDGTPSRRSWHDACAEEFKLIHWPAVTRRAVLDRDHGTCAACGCNAEREHARFMRAAPLWCGSRWKLHAPYWPRFANANGLPYPRDRHSKLQLRYNAHADLVAACAKARYERMKAMGWHQQSGWQHDHIRPLVEANGDLAFWRLSNIQTLCTPCHARKTADDARRRAKERRAKRLADLGQHVLPL